MFEGSGIDRKFIVQLLVVLFVVGPLLAWGLFVFTSSVPGRNTNDMKQAVTRYFDEQAGKAVLPEVEVKKFEKTDPYWYLVEYRFKGATSSQYVVVGDFEPEAEKMRVVTTPSTGFRRDNMSGLAVPYSLVDTLAEKLDESAHSEEEE